MLFSLHHSRGCYSPSCSSGCRCCGRAPVRKGHLCAHGWLCAPNAASITAGRRATCLQLRLQPACRRASVRGWARPIAASLHEHSLYLGVQQHAVIRIYHVRGCGAASPPGLPPYPPQPVHHTTVGCCAVLTEWLGAHQACIGRCKAAGSLLVAVRGVREAGVVDASERVNVDPFLAFWQALLELDAACTLVVHGQGSCREP